MIDEAERDANAPEGEGDTFPGEPPPAPIETEHGVFGQPRPVFDDFDDFDDFDGFNERSAGTGRRALLWVVGALLAGAVALWLAVLSLAQATDEQVALPALERGVSALTELEPLLDVQLEAIQEQADASAATLTPPGFPIRDASVRTKDVTRPDGTVDRVLLGDALLRKSARLIYTRGVSAFQRGDEAPEDASLLSVSGGIRALLDNLSSDVHGASVVWLWPLGAACLLLGALLLALAGGFGRFVALGSALVVASIPVLLGGLGARLVFSLVGGGPDDRLVDEFVAIGRRLSDLPIRNALWLAGAGVALALPAAVLDALFDRSVRNPVSRDAV